MQPPPPPLKAPTACDVCRRRKLRCDRQDPSCSNCLLYNSVCNYAKTRNKPGPPKGWKRRQPTSPQNNDSNPAKRQSLLESASTSKQTSASVPSSSTTPKPAAPENHTLCSQVATPPPSDVGTPFGSAGVNCPAVQTMETIPSFMGPLPTSWLDHQSVPGQDTIFDNLFTNGDFMNTFHLLDAHPASHTQHEDSEEPAPTRIPIDLAMLPSLPMEFFQPTSPFPSTSLSNYIAAENPLPMQPPRMFACPIALRYIHTFAPILSLSETVELITSCSQNLGSIHTTLFLNALDALMNVISPPSIPSPINYYLAAQNQYMSAYFSVLSPTVGPTDDSDLPSSHFLTAAALIYLTLHQVFTTGWTSSASTFLHLAIDIIERMPHDTAVQTGRKRWFARLAWLYGKVLDGCGAAPSLHIWKTAADPFDASHPEMAQIREAAPLAALQLDETMLAFDGLVDLCLDLENIVAVAERKDTSWLADLTQPMCTRAGQWIRTSPWAQESLVQLHSDPDAGSGGQSDEAQVRDTAARVLHLIYYGMSLKFETMDRTRCSIKKTSMYVAISKVVDAADYLIATHRLWLWPFAEPALSVSRDVLLWRSVESSNSALPKSPSTPWPSYTPSSGERTLLALIKDVYGAALVALDPTAPQRVMVAHAVGSISLLVDSGFRL